MTKRLGLSTALALLLAIPGPISAATLTLTGSALTIDLGSLPPLSIPQTVDPATIVVSSGAGFTEPAGIFAGTATWRPPITTPTGTPVPLISGLTIVASNGTKVVGPGSGPGGGFGGFGGLGGVAIVNVLQLFNLSIPLSPVGAGGSVMVTGGGISVTVLGTGWTTGPAQVTGITTVTPGLAVVNTATLTGSDLRTPTRHVGTVTLISPFKAITNVAGNLPGFALQRLRFVPEPHKLLLLGAAGLGLALLARSKAGRGADRGRERPAQRVPRLAEFGGRSDAEPPHRGSR